MKYNLAIDLGTSYFRAGLMGGDTILSEPSAVARGGYGKLVVGESAERMVGRHPESVEVLYPVQGGSVKDYNGTVQVLRYIVQKLIPKKLVSSFDVTLAISSALTPMERRALEEAIREVGARRVVFYDSLVAAAMGTNVPIEDPIGCLLISMGAGTTEVGLLSLGGVVDCRRLNVGGRTVDEKIMEWLRKERAFLIGARTAERLKWKIGTAQDSLKIKGRSLATGLPKEIEVPEAVVKQSLDDYYESIVGIIVQTMEACPPELVGDIMDHGIVLVGGGASDNKVLQTLTSRVEVPMIIAESPETCVIRGLMKANSHIGSSRGKRLPLVADKITQDTKKTVPQSWITSLRKVIK